MIAISLKREINPGASRQVRQLENRNYHYLNRKKEVATARPKRNQSSVKLFLRGAILHAHQQARKRAIIICQHATRRCSLLFLIACNCDGLIAIKKGDAEHRFQCVRLTIWTTCLWMERLDERQYAVLGHHLIHFFLAALERVMNYEVG